MALWLFVVAVFLTAKINALCSWNRAAVPSSNSMYANTLNFVNGKWSEDTSQSSDSTFNGQKYWKKTQYDGCYVPTLWLYYYKGTDNGDYRWLISPTFGSTPSSAYVQCDLDVPNPTDPVACNGHWIFAPNGTPNSNRALYESDSDFYFKPGDCPQVTCNYITFTSTGNDDYEGSYTRVSTNDQENLNVYQEENSASPTGVFYLFFHHQMFVWMVNDVLITNCQTATDGQVVALSTVGAWNVNSGISGTGWYFYEAGSSATRYLECTGQIPTTSPVASDSTGYPTTSTTIDYNCDVFPNTPYCSPAATPSPSKAPTSPTVSWPTVPTLPTTPTTPTTTTTTTTSTTSSAGTPTAATSGQARLQLGWICLVFTVFKLFL